MPLAGHPDNCACCAKTSAAFGARGRKRAGEEADLSTFLPQQPPEEGQPEWEEEEQQQQQEEEEEEEDALLSAHLFQAFDAHVAKLDAARLKRIEALSFKSALEDDGEGEVNEDASLDEIEGLGVWQPGDEFQGDVNYRTLQKLLTRVDQRGFERSAQQLEARPPFRLARRRLAHARVRCVCAVPRGLHEGRRARHLPRQLGDGAPGDHEEARLGKVQLGGAHQVHARPPPPPHHPTAAVSSRPCAQHPSALRKDVLASSRHLEPLPAMPPHPLACSPRNAASCSGVTARTCAWQHRHLLRVPCARVRAGDRCAAGRAPSPPARVLTRAPRAQSSSPQPVARRASCLSGSSSSERRSTPRCTRAARARAMPLPLAGLCDWREAKSASASTTRRRAASPPSTAASRSSVLSRPKWGCVSPRLEPA